MVRPPAAIPSNRRGASAAAAGAGAVALALAPARPAQSCRARRAGAAPPPAAGGPRSCARDRRNTRCVRAAAPPPAIPGTARHGGSGRTLAGARHALGEGRRGEFGGLRSQPSRLAVVPRGAGRRRGRGEGAGRVAACGFGVCAGERGLRGTGGVVVEWTQWSGRRGGVLVLPASDACLPRPRGDLGGFLVNCCAMVLTRRMWCQSASRGTWRPVRAL